MNAIESFVPSEVVKTFSAFLEFCYIARRNVISEDSLEQLKVALNKFHKSRQVFSGTVRADGIAGFSLPRQHAMVHYYDHIKNFGSPNGLCSSITESKHIAAVKRPWRRSNKHAALSQMLKVNQRLDKLAAARADFTARGMLAESCLIQAIRDAFSTDKETPMDEDAYDSDETDNSTSDEILVPDNDHPLNGADARTRSTTNVYVPGISDDQDSPALPGDQEDEDHGPVESGPLMNEVRLACKRGQAPPSQVIDEL